MDLFKNIFKGDKVVWVIFLTLCLISIVEVFSASSTLTYKSGDYWAPVTQHSIYLLCGAFIIVGLHNINYKWFVPIAITLIPISMLLLVLVMFMGKVNDASRYIPLFGRQFQPSEIAKFAVVITTAFLLAKGQTEDGVADKTYKQILIVAGIICVLIFPENFSTAVLLFAVVLMLMCIGRVSLKKLGKLVGGLAGIALAGFLFLEATKNADIQVLHRFDTWRARIENFMKTETVPPEKYDLDKNGQVGHARIAVATSNVLGKGPGNSVERDFLSQAYSDFIYAIIIEELGLVGGIVVVLLYIALLFRVGMIAKRCNKTFPALLIIGVALLLVTQAIFNMMVAVGLAPVTGQPLPLISRGGTSTFINCAYFGIILSVSRYTESLKDAEEAEDPENMQKELPPLGKNAEILNENEDILL